MTRAVLQAERQFGRGHMFVGSAYNQAALLAWRADQMDEAVLNLKKERFNLRFQRATGQLENTSRLREARRDIARIKTVAAQKRDGKKK